jgi:hypothetical protein
MTSGDEGVISHSQGTKNNRKAKETFGELFSDLTTALSWDITQQVEVLPYRLPGFFLVFLTLEDGTDRLS